MKLLTTLLCTAFLTAQVLAVPPVENELQGRAAAVDNIVYVTDANKFWYVHTFFRGWDPWLTSFVAA